MPLPFVILLCTPNAFHWRTCFSFVRKISLVDLCRSFYIREEASGSRDFSTYDSKIVKRWLWMAHIPFLIWKHLKCFNTSLILTWIWKSCYMAMTLQKPQQNPRAEHSADVNKGWRNKNQKGSPCSQSRPGRGSTPNHIVKGYCHMGLGTFSSSRVAFTES